MKTLIEDGELRRLRAMAKGLKPFERSGLWQRLAALDLMTIQKLTARERLGVGYYAAAPPRTQTLLLNHAPGKAHISHAVRQSPRDGVCTTELVASRPR